LNREPEDRESRRLEEALAWLASFTDYEQLLHQAPARTTFDLGRLRRLLLRIGNPESHGRIVHVAGTKGKSSVVYLSEALLRAHGCRTFRFLSPHLESVTERLAVDGTPASAAVFADLVDRLRPEIARLGREAPEDLPSFFEATTIMGFQLARDAECDVSVLEVGLGGRLDATNVVEPTVCLITEIAMDHTRILGNTLASIAAEKAGIIKAGTPVAALARPDTAAHAVIRDRARTLEAPLLHPGAGLAVSAVEPFIREDGGPGLRFDAELAGVRWQGLELRAGAAHQAWNAILALHGARVVLEDLGRPLDPEICQATLAALDVPARAEWIPGTPPILLDGAHTLESMRDLARVADLVADGRNVHLLCALTRDRDPRTVFAPMVDCARTITTTTIPTPRGRPAAEVAASLGSAGGIVRAEPDPLLALQQARSAAGRDGIVVIAGSLYLAGTLRGRTISS
jgi:dihydrofolate synthase/folylpolyglutamate synthase